MTETGDLRKFVARMAQYFRIGENTAKSGADIFQVEKIPRAENPGLRLPFAKMQTALHPGYDIKCCYPFLPSRRRVGNPIPVASKPPSTASTCPVM